jgi:Zn-dependent peptidase ImmA (M78 family)
MSGSVQANNTPISLDSVGITEEVIKYTVGEVHTRYLSSFGEWKLPILVQDLTKFMPIRVHEIRVSDVPKGKIIFGPDGASILIPRAFCRVRRRIEAAHELAHILLNHYSPVQIQGNRTTSYAESLDVFEEWCEKTGRLMLIPEAFLPRLENLSTEVSLGYVIIQVARRWGVPVPTAIMRILDQPMAGEKLRTKQIIVWDVENETANSSQCLLKASWHACRIGFIPHQNKVRLGSITYKAAVHMGTDRYVCGVEEVKIGSLQGIFYVDACPYGIGRYKRVLTVFREPDCCVDPLFKKNTASGDTI